MLGLKVLLLCIKQKIIVFLSLGGIISPLLAFFIPYIVFLIIPIYDVTSRDSFVKTDALFQMLEENVSSSRCTILVGNKCSLEERYFCILYSCELINVRKKRLCVPDIHPLFTLRARAHNINTTTYIFTYPTNNSNNYTSISYMP